VSRRDRHQARPHPNGDPIADRHAEPNLNRNDHRATSGRWINQPAGFGIRDVCIDDLDAGRQISNPVTGDRSDRDPAEDQLVYDGAADRTQSGDGMNRWL
jgi:hypothetical protein